MIRTKFAPAQTQTHIKAGHRFCNFCGYDEIEEGEHDSVFYRWTCPNCERGFYQSRVAQWQKFCTICHLYIDYQSLCGCFFKKRKEPVNVQAEQASKEEEGSTEALRQAEG